MDRVRHCYSHGHGRGHDYGRGYDYDYGRGYDYGHGHGLGSGLGLGGLMWLMRAGCTEMSLEGTAREELGHEGGRLLRGC